MSGPPRVTERRRRGDDRCQDFARPLHGGGRADTGGAYLLDMPRSALSTRFTRSDRPAAFLRVARFVRAAGFVLLAGASLLSASCGAALGGGGARAIDRDSRLHAGSAPSLEGPRVVVVTIDGVRWQEIFSGTDPALDGGRSVRPARALVPNLYKLIDRGVALAGAGVIASGPRFVSLPGYREILTGRQGDDCEDNGCAPIDEPTLLDEARAATGRAADVAAIASWEAIERAASWSPERITISAGRHRGASRDGVRASDEAAELLERGQRAVAWPGHDDYRPDAYTAELALAYLSAAHPRLLYVSLGDTDEWAHRGDYRGYLDALAAFDAFLGRLDEKLTELDGAPGRSLILVTTDHGRARGFAGHWAEPEAQRVWLVAAGGGVPVRGVVTPSGPRRLADIAPTLRLLLGLDADRSTHAGAPIPELLPPALATRAGGLF